MIKKKILVILISIAFAFIVLFSCASLLSIKKVEVNFALASSDVQNVQKILDKNLDKNLLFLDEKEVEDLFKSEPYLEVVSVDKKYPNVLSVNVKERREVYKIDTGLKSYVLDESGVVLNDTGIAKQGGEIIDLSFIAFKNNPNLNTKIEVVSAKLGEKLKTTNDQVFNRTLSIAKSVGLFDCIKKIEIEYCSGEEFDVGFETKTGVKLHVVDLLDDGERKGQVCFDVYNQIATDYQKRFGNIEAMFGVDGEQGKLFVIHTFDDIDASNRVDVPLIEEDI